MSSVKERVLVTGASGFIAKHIVLRLIADGYRVRGTVRGDGKAEEVRRVIGREGLDPLSFEPVLVDLERDEGWDAAVAGCRFVLHTASPFPRSQPRDKFGLVSVARGGTLRVLEAAKKAGVERAVLTSSVAAVFYGHQGHETRPYGEADFSNVDSAEISPYAVSKTEAEKAAWDCVRGSSLELVAINPSLVLGPVLDEMLGTSARIVAMMMSGKLPALPEVSFGIVDVRDVAGAHVAAMNKPEAAGRRFIVSSEDRTLMSVVDTIRIAYPDYASRLPRFTIPTLLVKAAALVSSQAAMLASEIGRNKRLDTRPTREDLGLQFRAGDEAIHSLAESLIRFKLV